MDITTSIPGFSSEVASCFSAKEEMDKSGMSWIEWRVVELLQQMSSSLFVSMQ